MARVHVPIFLRWSDFDAYGHVNNAEMLHLLEEARMEVFWGSPDRVSPPSTAVLEGGPGAETLSVIARQEVEYLNQIPYQRMPVDAEIWISRLGAADMDICYELYSPIGVTPRILYTRAMTNLVTIDAVTGSPRRMPPEHRAAWTDVQDEPLIFKRR
jgi:acyl-CoA thioester hydrolase